MRIEKVETPERFAQIETDWDEVYKKDPHANFYLSSRFVGTIVRHAARRFRIYVAWAADGACAGVFPVYVRTKWSNARRRLVNEIDMLGHLFDADYTGLLCDPRHEAVVCEAFAREASCAPVRRLVLSYFATGAERLEAFVAGFDTAVFETTAVQRRINSGETDNLICPYIDLPGDFSDYLAGLGANARQKLRRLLRRLDDDPDLSVAHARPETFKRDAAALSDLWRRQYTEKKGAKRAGELARQLEKVALVGLAHGHLRLAVLRRAGRPIAAHALYLDPVKRAALFHVGGRDESVRDLAAGLLLHAHEIRWSIANGLERYDFTLGDEAYKYALGAKDRAIACVEIATRSGVNAAGGLDEGCADYVAELIRLYAARGRHDDARAAARQALETWPDMASASDVEALIAEAARRG